MHRKIKGFITYIFIMTLLIIGVLVGCTKRNENLFYTENGVVVATENDVVIVECNGNLWEFCGIDFKANDPVTISFYRNKTENIFDDEIVDVTKIEKAEK